ncbi:MAG TPA: PIG-L deacetylase family protein [Ktedonobacterales bacterium]|jgi:LmbE family N-acetylglucosaminyl deacetylase|nr:PIG-L deacetylase family protein [Ktedonobacterales bacterium]
MSAPLFPAGRTCLVVAAHPDDAESWCAGAVATLTLRGWHAIYVLCTSGEKGTANPAEDPLRVAARRELEQIVACQLVGAGPPIFLHHADGGLEDDVQLRGLLVRQIRCWRPDLLLTHDPVHPWPPYTAHRDHRIAGRVALDAAYPFARDPLHFPEQLQDEGLLPHAVPEVWLFCSAQPDHYVDIAAGLEAKIAARLAHASQTSDPAALAADWRRRAEETGRAGGLALAEAFKRLVL